MCVVSLVIDEWTRRNPPWELPSIPEVSRSEFEAMKRELEELKKLLKAAKEYDTNTGQSDCEKPELVKLIKKLAEDHGIDLEDVL